MKIIFISTIALLSVAGVAYFYNYEKSGNTLHTVKLTEDGFAPSAITIAKGDTVVFTTTRNKPFWPASDLHPTHGIYSEFDPKQPIEANQSWSFRFDKTGEWRFHDHLAPLFRGTVRVQDSHLRVSVINIGRTFQECMEYKDENSKVQCWQKALVQTLQQQGIDAAFQMFGNFYDTNTAFRQNCHSFTHLLGQEAYQKFKEHGHVNISPKTSYCGYGFYHGFMEALIYNGTVAKAREFCISVNQQLASQTNAWTPCLHGIGHGVTDASDSTAWGNTQAMIQPGLMICEKLGVDDYEKDLCASGVFNSLANFYGNPTYHLSLDKQDPLAICRKQDQTYFKAACYGEMNTLLMNLADGDFRRAARFIETMSEYEYQARAIDSLATHAVHFSLTKDQHDHDIQTCHVLLPQLRAPCIAGLGAGSMEFGTPEKEYIQALAVCDDSVVNLEERKACFARVLWLTSLRYPAEQQTSICASVAPPYRQHCPVEL